MVHEIIYTFSQCVIFFMYAIVFRFGAFLVLLPPENIGSASFEDIFVVLFALVFGAIGAGKASAYAPNYVEAKHSANRIFFLLDREPKIDSYSEDGEKLVSMGYAVKPLIKDTLNEDKPPYKRQV